MPRPETTKRQTRSAKQSGGDHLPVFSDPKHRRRVIVETVVAITFLVVALWAFAFALSMFRAEPLPGNELSQLATQNRITPGDGLSVMQEELELASGVCDEQSENGPRIVHAYAPFWFTWAPVSLSQSCGQVDVLLSERFALSPSPDGPQMLGDSGANPMLDRAIAKYPNKDLTIVPVVIPPVEARPQDMVERINDSVWRAQVVENLAGAIRRNDFDGVCLNLPVLTKLAPKAVADLISEIQKKVAGPVCILLPGDDPYWLTSDLPEVADQIVVSGYRNNPAGTLATPIAAQPWFETMLDDVASRVDPKKLIVGIGNFAQSWGGATNLPERLSFAESMRRTARNGGHAALATDALNTFLRYSDVGGGRHEIWLLDAVSAFNQLVALDRQNIQNVAVFSLGYEDPALWRVFASPAVPPAELALSLGPVWLDHYVGFEGDGVFRSFLDTTKAGYRNLTLEPQSGLIVGQTYAQIPEPYSIVRFGPEPYNRVAITFDDGPDPDYTTEILDILQDRQAPAAFFVVGENVLKSPDILRRMIDEGHEVGSHLFFHPAITEVPVYRVMAELFAMQRLIASMTGRGAVFFRAPYGIGEEDMQAEQARPLQLISQAGYIHVGGGIAPRDWENLTPDQIVDQIMDALERQEGRVISLHDSGGDRSATVQATGPLIDRLRADGYSVVSLAQMLGTTRDAIMPPTSGKQETFTRYSFGFFTFAGTGAMWIFWGAVLIGTIRSLGVLLLAFTRRHFPLPDKGYCPSVAVVIPAFNEEEGILDCLSHVLASDYPDLSVVVVDNNSSDQTSARVRETYGDDPRVRLIQQPIKGKSAALNMAYEQITAEIVVAIDADTVILPDAISMLAGAFCDPKVGAVAGNVKVRNRHNLLSVLQALEYITAQNIDRRAYETIRGLLVVPGAIGAWRAEAVRKAGLYSNDTVTEDADLTIALTRAGYRVRFEERAIALTDAPDRLKGFLRQRLRWIFGMLQTAWKHRGAYRQAKGVGMVAIPDLIVFGFILGLMAPVADLVFLGTLLNGVVSLISDQTITWTRSMTYIVTGYLALPLLDFIIAIAAFGFERRERRALLLLLPLRHLIYRPILYFCVYRAVARALLRPLVKW